MREMTLYHATDESIAKKILQDKFIVKKNTEHWLGNGIYFYRDISLANWWKTRPSSKYSCNMPNPVIVQVEIQVDESKVLDLGLLKDYQQCIQEFQVFYEKFYVVYFDGQTNSIEAMRSAFFDYLFLSKDIQMIIGNFYLPNQPYISQHANDQFKQFNLEYFEEQVCIAKDKQDIIISKKII